LKEAQGALRQTTKGKIKMKRNLIALTAAAAIGLGGFGAALAKTGPAGRGFGLERLTKALDLTPDQQAKVQPILDQTRPQLTAIHQDAAAKSRTVISTALTQIRPLLTPEQQKKLDAQQKAHEDLRTARKEAHEPTND
jgi:Spy/CpxP family protein refolding chaperone